MNENDHTNTRGQAGNAAQQQSRHPQRPGINWFRFWMQMVLAAIAFNIVAGLVTWFFVFPHLFPAH